VGRMQLIASLALALALAGCSRPQRPLTVGSKNGSEQTVLGEIVAQHLEKRLHTAVVRRLNLGSSLLLHESLVAGQVDVYPEYAGSALTSILKLSASNEQDVVAERLKREYEALQLVWGPPLGFHHGFVMVVRGSDASAAKLETLDDAARYRDGWSLGVTDEFMERPDGYSALIRIYSPPLNGGPKLLPASDVYRALKNKEVNMVVGNVTDPALENGDVKVLRDDHNAFPVYDASLVAREAAFQQHPGLREALDALVGKFSDQSVRKLNYEVRTKRRPVVEVAKQFLAEAGL
jgi:osmoprotectant transport system substrate-binding protein